MEGFIKLMRSAETLIKSDPNAFLILTQAALRANRETGIAYVGVSDFPSMTRAQYRSAIGRLQQPSNDHAGDPTTTIQTTKRGTVVTFIKAGVYDINHSTTTMLATEQQPSSCQKTTTNKEKNIKKKNKYTPPTPQGVDEINWQEYLKTRTKLKCPNTERAIKTLTNRIIKLAAQGDNPNELVELANSNGWKSVYPIPEDKRRQNALTAEELINRLNPASHCDQVIRPPAIDVSSIYQSPGQSRIDPPKLVVSLEANTRLINRTGDD